MIYPNDTDIDYNSYLAHIAVFLTIVVEYLIDTIPFYLKRLILVFALVLVYGIFTVIFTFAADVEIYAGLNY